jgi:hypothetical protein
MIYHKKNMVDRLVDVSIQLNTFLRVRMNERRLIQNGITTENFLSLQAFFSLSWRGTVPSFFRRTCRTSPFPLANSCVTVDDSTLERHHFPLMNEMDFLHRKMAILDFSMPLKHAGPLPRTAEV